MPQHIGIVACSAEGAALCYRTICMEGAAWLGAHGHPEISMHTPSLAAYVERLDRGDLDGVAALMLYALPDLKELMQHMSYVLLDLYMSSIQYG